MPCVFFVANTVLRRFCYQKNCKNVADLLHACFPKTAGVFLTLFLTCSFVCIVTMLAGVQDCAASFFPTPLPLFSVAVAVISALLLKKGLTALKVLNALSLLLAVAYLVALAFTTNNTFQRGRNATFHADTICAVFHNDVAWRDCTVVRKANVTHKQLW